jgi:glycosyltransferase involved in cell wall biosynthesis
MKVGLVITNHSSEKIRPYGRDLLLNALGSFKKTCNFSYEIIIVDNQSDINLSKFPENQVLSQILNNCHYIYIEDQWKKGLTGAWNIGIKKAHELGCDIILNSNDDLIFNESINTFINKIIENPDADMSMFGPLTNGVNGSFEKIQMSNGPDHTKSKEILGEGWEGFVSGFFFGFTKKFYEKFRYPDGDLFAEFDKFDKTYIHKYAGDCGKWGGQEMETLRFKESGGKVFVIGECWIYHLKKRDWSKARKIAGEYGWHLTEKFS